MPEALDECVSPAAGPIVEAEGRPLEQERVQKKEGAAMGVMVGKPAPDFEASAFVQGGFKNIKLSDYRGKWVVICFYPGDFTFV